MWLRIGECNECGKCCDLATLPLRMAIYQNLGIPMLLNENFPCKDFSYIDGKGHCAIYDQRPDMCRAFPRQPVDILGLPECSYQFIWVEP